MSLNYHLEGAEDAPVLVLLHAIATSSELWRPQLGVLSRHFRVVRIDLPGHGQSALLHPDATYADYADAVAATMAGAGIDRYVLAGLSFGAMVSMQVAVRHAVSVRGLVLANCMAKTPPPVAQMWQNRIAAVASNGMDGQTAPTLERWFTPGFHAKARLTVEWVRSMILNTPPQGFIAAAGMISTMDHSGLLPPIACPTLVLAGAHDQAAPVAGLEAIAAQIPGARLETLDAAHLANVEAPVAFAEAVGSFAHSL